MCPRLLVADHERVLADGYIRLRVVVQLSQLYVDLNRTFHRDPEQELTGVALSVVDHLFAAARETLERDGPPAPLDVAFELISPETLETGAPVRAVDVLVVTGQILAAFGGPIHQALHT